ncbi:dihydrodipicolinate synthase family protein [Arcobacter sp.]|uniref:dihydrodipicolinate synthase family protein n=1 Tax=unclassified Arcobacter TaxID=2593671 RepID=UPI003B00C6C3|eukprot:TRINITY_DN4336_c0_g1_i3.p1 TRINITY_DN4336_c0_g1~~TRINITY_DN4336_c0_g1_i3.p1  ORF type:complete len:299 (-),score=-50.92 TRINITY_DN4336_c0_g1_i3:108-1004(-)
MGKIQGVFPPLITVFNEDSTIDIDSIKKHIDFLIEKGVDGVAILGTTGEFFSLSFEEKKFLVENILAHTKNRIKVIVGVGETNSSKAFKFINYLEDKDVEALLVINPYFVVYDEETIIKYYGEICNRTSKNVLIYNFPTLSGFDFTYDIVRKIALKNDNLIGIKETVENIKHIEKMLKIKDEKKDFSVFCAFESQAIDALNLGVDGFINATVNFAPEFTVNTYKYFNEGNEELTKEYFDKMNSAMKIYTYSQPLLQACKQAVYFRVLKENKHEKLPAYSLSEEKKQELKSDLQKLNIL